jgi:gluconate 2-dehydrogenase gamma chain
MCILPNSTEQSINTSSSDDFQGRRQRKEDSLNAKISSEGNTVGNGRTSNNRTRSRRSVLVGVASGLSSTWVTSNWPRILAAQDRAQKAGQSGRFAFLSPEQALEVEAMATQIIPTDSSPGAREARVVHFIDQALASFVRDKQSDYVKGLQNLQTKTKQAYPEASLFSAMTSEQQIKVLTEIERTPFFALVRTHTIIGFFSRPEHGGNHNKVGWELIGYDDSLKHKPPFGYYDEQSQRLSGVKEKRR